MIYIFLALLVLSMCVGFFRIYIWLRVLAARSNRDEAEIREIKEMIFSLTQICMPGRRIAPDLIDKKYRE